MRMHIYFSGIGGTGIGPLAIIAQSAGLSVSGSDKQHSKYTDYLVQKGIDVHIGQEDDSYIQTLHVNKPIDWFVYSSALPLEKPDHPELHFVNSHGIKHSKRDEFLSFLLKKTGLKLIAFAGTHGKTSSTAMAVWVAHQLKLPISYSVGAKLSFGDMGVYDKNSTYFLYECDEFDKNFLSYHPYLSVLTKVDWDHHEQYPLRTDYIAAFQTFVTQSKTVFAHKQEIEYLSLADAYSVHAIDENYTTQITLKGEHARRNAAGVVAAMQQISQASVEDIITAVNSFPGSNRRFEEIAPRIYSDYAHTPEEIAATLQLAREYGKKIVVAYEPLTNRRQHFMIQQYKDVFNNLEKLYWLPSYLAREDPHQRIIPPIEFVETLDSSANARAATMNSTLKSNLLQAARNENTIVLLLAGGGGNSLDEWARTNLSV
jgi:UDP-N-acetylmuramate--alanine ligase